MNDTSAPPVPRVFARRIDMPPAAPWDQTKAAHLDARLGAPLGDRVLAYDLRRLRPWRPGAPGTFAVGYVRWSDVSGEPIDIEVDDAVVRFRFRTRESRRRALRLAAVRGGLAALAVVAFGLSAAKALSVRAQNEALLAKLETNARGWDRLARQNRQADTELRDLRRAGAEGRSFADLAADLYWLGRAKAPSANIERVRWTDGTLSVVTQGIGPPVLGAERPVDPMGDVAGSREWRIGVKPAVEVRGGVARPSVVLGSKSATPLSRGGRE